ncbi:hypothetical protein C8J57DRAFT_1482106 [Mycena rebaudengoi]|nr:hypothetical protein C8J57DRAFT_1482106 [Mycena rebaudengoi]
MDEHYHLKEAIARLAKLSSRRRAATEDRDDPSDRHLGAIDPSADREQADTVAVHQTGETRKEWRLCGCEEGGTEPVEMTARVQGILVTSDLVPSSRRHSKASDNFQNPFNHLKHSEFNRIYLSQRVSISGYGTEDFADSMGKKEELYGLFERYFPEGTMRNTNIAAPLKHDIFACQLRDCSPPKQTPLTVEDIPFPPQMDPIGVLEQLKGSDLMHVKENQVVCMKRLRDTRTGDIIYVSASPANFRPGDIVELETGQDHRDDHRLQSITLLDSNFSKGAELRRRDAKRVAVPQPYYEASAPSLVSEEHSTDDDDDTAEPPVSDLDADADGEATGGEDDEQMVYIPAA